LSRTLAISCVSTALDAELRKIHKNAVITAKTANFDFIFKKILKS